MVEANYLWTNGDFLVVQYSILLINDIILDHADIINDRMLTHGAQPWNLLMFLSIIPLYMCHSSGD